MVTKGVLNMTLKRLRALALLPFFGLVACGGGGGADSGGAIANRPVANFQPKCTDLVCTFTNLSTDKDGDALSYTWELGDGTVATTADVTHTYAVGKAFNVKLTVVDGSVARLSAVYEVEVTVTAPAAAAAPHADFTISCSSLDCTYTDTSTYDPGSIFQSRVWDFGDGTPVGSGSPATHRYAATTLKTYAVKLTVTDAAGKVSTSTQTIPVAPPASALLTLTQASKVSVTLVSSSCSALGNDVIVTAPITQTIVTNGCFTPPVGVAVPLNGGATFAANTVLQVSVLSGLSGTTKLITPPAIRVTGDFTTGWTLTFDDGFGGAGEPDFNDLVILVKATP